MNVWDVSPTGTVCGQGFNILGQPPGYLWSPGGDIIHTSFVDPAAISADGRTVVGNSLSAGGYIWTMGIGARLLPVNPHERAFPKGVSGDGSIVVGLMDNTNPEVRDLMFRYSVQGGMERLWQGDAYDITPDGGIIVGTLDEPDIPSYTAVLYDQQGLVHRLGVAPGMRWSYARAVSANGKVVVGNCDSPFAILPFRWTAETGMVSLGDIPGGVRETRAADCNGDGSIVVGSGRTLNNGSRAFIWDQVHGMRILSNVLQTDYGFDLTGWELWGATAITPDGRIICGNGQYTVNGVNLGHAFVAVLPSGCYANCDESLQPPTLNINDFACFLNRYAAGDTSANCDESTASPVLNVGDFMCFLNRYAAGCP